MTYLNAPLDADDIVGLAVAADDFSARASNSEFHSPSGFQGVVGGNTLTAGSGSSSYAGQSYQYFSWVATFDGVNVTGSVRWFDPFSPLQTIRTFAFSGAGTLTTEVLPDGYTRQTVSFAGPAQATPEPATLPLLGTGPAGVGFAERRRSAAL